MEAIEFGERVIQLLDVGRKTSTYKYALLLALLDLAIERNLGDGDVVTSFEIASKVAEMYWPQVASCNLLNEEGRAISRLKQNSGNPAKVLSLLSAYQQDKNQKTSNAFLFEQRGKANYKQLIHNIEEVLVKQPIPRLQNIGGTEHRFIYEYHWEATGDRTPQGFGAYRRGDQSSSFDNRIILYSGVGKALRRLNGLLRPYIMLEWSNMVANLNTLPSEKLQHFLFDSGRLPVAQLRDELLKLQDNKCFYTGTKLTAKIDIDHFIPRARHPNDGVFNLVATHAALNQNKKDHLASSMHLENWIKRNEKQRDDLLEIASNKNWVANEPESLLTAKSLYESVRPDMLLWNGKDKFIEADLKSVKGCFADIL